MFSLCGAIKGVSQVLNPSFLIAWAQLKLAGLRMLSEGQNLAHLLTKLSITRHHITISDELPEARND